MTRLEQIQQQLSQLPLEKQSEVLDFVAYLHQRQTAGQQRGERRTLRQHPAFGSWHGRDVDALDYQRAIRAEWDGRA